MGSPFTRRLRVPRCGRMMVPQMGHASSGGRLARRRSGPWYALVLTVVRGFRRLVLMAGDHHAIVSDRDFHVQAKTSEHRTEDVEPLRGRFRPDACRVVGRAQVGQDFGRVLSSKPKVRQLGDGLLRELRPTSGGQAADPPHGARQPAGHEAFSPYGEYGPPGIALQRYLLAGHPQDHSAAYHVHLDAGYAAAVAADDGDSWSEGRDAPTRPHSPSPFDRA